uniref:Putative ovule protein n=1 Tax=Solanum chacoense TaxID=4108 RepID=A0A0V0GVY3_SOLCH
MMSSAHDKWFIGGLYLGMPYPLKSLSSWSLFKPLANTSVAMINKVGDNKSPCFNPLDDLIWLPIH